MAYATFARTGLVAALGFRMFARLTVFECRRTWRYLSSEDAITLYRATWTYFLIACCACWWLGQQTRALVQPLVDSIVEDALPADAPQLPTVTSEVVAVVRGYWESLRAFLGGVELAYELAWAVLLSEAHHCIEATFTGQKSLNQIGDLLRFLSGGLRRKFS